MTRDDITQLFRHMEWADSLIWSSVMATEAAQRDGAVVERLHHIHLVQRIYLQMWLNHPERGRELSTFSGPAEVRDWARAYYRLLDGYLEQVDATALAAVVEFPWADQLVEWFGELRSATMEETALQVAMHTSHHRGQLAMMIRQHGGEPPLVDFIAWIWMGRPEPVWESVTTS